MLRVLDIVAEIKTSFALRLQRVGGDRLDITLVADLHCSHLHSGAAPIVSHVSAPLVRVRVCASVHLCECVCVCVYASFLVRFGDCVCVSRYRTIDIFEGIETSRRRKRV
jgi:hypothetical protein